MEIPVLVSIIKVAGNFITKILDLFLRDKDGKGIKNKQLTVPNNPAPIGSVRVRDIKSSGGDVQIAGGNIIYNLPPPVPKKSKKRIHGTLPPVWNVPPRNPNFIGRESVLEMLQQSLSLGKNISLTQQTFHGLGGIGKTQLAVEYAYRHSAEYDVVWWMHAEDGSTLKSDYAALVIELNLPEKADKDQAVIIQAVKKWLNHNPKWLLVFDNAKDSKSIRDCLPGAEGGHVLITSRNQEWSGTSLEIKVWSRKESIDFLHKRTGLNDDKVDNEIAEALGDLPLALEQASAYIKKSHIGYAEYLELFTARRKELWAEGEKPPDDYPDTVATTWLLAFEATRNILFAKDLLNLCSLVAPDVIPRSLISKALWYHSGKGGDALTINLKINNAIAELSSYSLISAEPESLAIHRLVQTVACDRMEAKEIALYRESAIIALSELFPIDGQNNSASWPECKAFLPHAETVMASVGDDDSAWNEWSVLLNKMASYFHGRASYGEAENLFRRALVIEKNTPLYKARTYSNFGFLLDDKLNEEEAERMFLLALNIMEQEFGNEHIDVVVYLNNLAGLKMDQKKYNEAESLYLRALNICKKKLPTTDLLLGASLNNMGYVLMYSGQLEMANNMFRQALDIFEKQPEKCQMTIAKLLNNLAFVACFMQDYGEAKRLIRRAVSISEHELGSEHPQTINHRKTLNFIDGKGR